MSAFMPALNFGLPLEASAKRSSALLETPISVLAPWKQPL
jgi:hypothetical protein